MPSDRRGRAASPVLPCMLTVLLLAAAPPANAQNFNDIYKIPKEQEEPLKEAANALEAGDYKKVFTLARPLTGPEISGMSVQWANALLKKAKTAFAEQHASATGPIDLRAFDERRELQLSPAEMERVEEIGLLYKAGHHEAALKMWRELADEGNFMAQYAVGVIYSDGKIVDINDDESLRYFKKGAIQRDVPALKMVLAMAMIGLPAPRDAPRTTSEEEQELAQSEFFLGSVAMNFGVLEGYQMLALQHCKSPTMRNPVLADVWTYMAFPAKEDFLPRICNDEVEHLASYYDAIKERAEAMSKAYDIPIGGMKDSDSVPSSPGR